MIKYAHIMELIENSEGQVQDLRMTLKGGMHINRTAASLNLSEAVEMGAMIQV